MLCVNVLEPLPLPLARYCFPCPSAAAVLFNCTSLTALQLDSCTAAVFGASRAMQRIFVGYPGVAENDIDWPFVYLL